MALAQERMQLTLVGAAGDKNETSSRACYMYGGTAVPYADGHHTARIRVVIPDAVRPGKQQRRATRRDQALG